MEEFPVHPGVLNGVDGDVEVGPRVAPLDSPEVSFKGVVEPREVHGAVGDGLRHFGQVLPLQAPDGPEGVGKGVPVPGRG